MEKNYWVFIKLGIDNPKIPLFDKCWWIYKDTEDNYFELVISWTNKCILHSIEEKWKSESETIVFWEYTIDWKMIKIREITRKKIVQIIR